MNEQLGQMLRRATTGGVDVDFWRDIVYMVHYLNHAISSSDPAVREKLEPLREATFTMYAAFNEVDDALKENKKQREAAFAFAMGVGDPPWQRR